MSRYIDADALAKEIKQDIADAGLTERFVFYRINEAPSIDIVRCVECRYKGMEICPMYKLTKAGVLKPYDFCSYGCREEE
jgi:hypothetical protein